jgi:hypothetical protein
VIATLATNRNSLQKHWLWWTMVEVPWRATPTKKVVRGMTVKFLGWTPLWLALCVHKVLWYTQNKQLVVFKPFIKQFKVLCSPNWTIPKHPRLQDPWGINSQSCQPAMEVIPYKCILQNVLQLEQDREMICFVPTLHIQPYKCILYNVLQLKQDREMGCFVPNPPDTNHLSKLIWLYPRKALWELLQQRYRG